MATIVTRAGKGSALTHVELDANFNNLNNDKAELSGASFTGNVSVTGTLSSTGNLSTTGTLIQKVGSDVASATALTLGVGNIFDITGTTAITSIVTKGVGTKVTLQFDNILVLTHHATDLILPSGASITTAAGDIGVFFEYATGDWRCESYERADGTAVVESTTNLFLATPQASTSGTEIDFTGIPAGTKRITIMFSEVSTNASSDIIVQLGDSGGLETTGYAATTVRNTASANTTTGFTAGFAMVVAPSAATAYNGQLTLNLINSSTFVWVGSGIVNVSASNVSNSCSGNKTLSAELTQIRITTVVGTNTFDAGEININYE